MAALSQDAKNAVESALTCGPGPRAEIVNALNATASVTPGTQVASKAVVPDANVNIGATKVTALSIGTSGAETLLTPTGAEINRVATLSTRIVTVTGDTTITAAAHDGKTVLINNAGASSATMTLPTASGSGARFRFFVGTTLSGGGTIIITDGGAHLFGSVNIISDSAFQAGTLFTVGGISAGTGSTNFTMDGTTKGGKKGDIIEVEDMATNVYAIRAIVSGSGTEATMFS